MSKRDGNKLQGVGGWLALLVHGMLWVGPLLAVVRTSADFSAAERAYPELAQLAEWSSFKTVEWIAILIFSGLSAWGGLTLVNKRTPDAVARAKFVLWFNYPVSVIVTGVVIPLVMIKGGASVAAANIGTLIAALIAVSIWTAYLNRSIRVKNTYGLEQSTLIQNTLPETREYPVAVSVAGAMTRSQKSEVTSHVQPSEDLVTVAREVAEVNEDRVYAAIAQEIESGLTDKGMWTRLFAECGGDEKQVKVLYIKQRAHRLIVEERLLLEKIARDHAVEAEKLEQIRREAERLADPRLIAAVWGGNWASASKLLHEGVKPVGSDENGNSLLDLARKRGDKQMIQLLESYCASPVSGLDLEAR